MGEVTCRMVEGSRWAYEVRRNGQLLRFTAARRLDGIALEYQIRELEVGAVADGAPSAAPMAPSSEVEPVVTAQRRAMPVSYAREGEAALARFGRMLDAERARAAVTAREYERAVSGLADPLKVGYAFRSFGRGGAEWGPWLQRLGSDPAPLDARLLVGRPDGLVYPWYGEQGIPTSCPEAEREEEWFARAAAGLDVLEYTMPEMWDVYPRPEARLVRHKVNCRRAVPERERPDLYLCLSPAAQEALEGTWPDVPRVIVPYGVPLSGEEAAEHRSRVRTEAGIPEGATVALWCGRLHAWEKDRGLLERCIAEIDREELWWIVVGYFDEERAAHLRGLWEEFIAGRRVVWRDDLCAWQVRPFYDAADLVVSTSETEGLGIALQDGLGAGLPVVAVDSGGSQYIVASGATGYLTPRGDDEALLGAVEAMLDLPAQQRREMGARGRELAAARFDPVVCARRRLVAYADLVARGPVAVPPLDLRAPVHSGAQVLARAGQPADLPEIKLPKLGARLRVTLVTDSPLIGGLPWRAAWTMWYLRRAGVEAQIVYRNRRERHRSLEEWLDGRVPFTYCGTEAEVRAELARQEPQVVQVGWPPVQRGLDGPWRTVGWFAGPGARAALDAAPELAEAVDQWILVSEAMRPLLPAALRGKAVVIPSTVPLDPTAAARDWTTAREALGIGTELVALWCGRIGDPRKRVDLVYQLARRLPDVRFLLAGDFQGTAPGDHTAALAECGNVTWLPDLRPWEMGAVYGLADVYLQTSEAEGLSVAAMEAAAAGCALLLTNVGGSAEIVERGVNGALLGAEAEEFAWWLRWLADTPGQAATMGASSRRIMAERGGLAEYVLAYRDLYAGLAKEGASDGDVSVPAGDDRAPARRATRGARRKP